jgi:dihydroorotate dehydrogenase (fumarate)
MADLTTKYLDLELANPLVVSPSPLQEEIDHIREMEDSGAAAVVLHSLFEEQINLESQELDRGLLAGTESFAESLNYLPDLADYNLGPEGYLEHIRRAKEAVGIPIIASLNGVSTEGWVRYARDIEDAGADALELNIYHLPTDPRTSGEEVERHYRELVAAVRAQTRIPLAVKLGAYFSSTANMAVQLDEAGADALVLFNRFYQPDFDLESLEVTASLTLSSPPELLLRLHWVAIIFGYVQADLAITGGVHSAVDVLKCMMAGARVAMMTSALLKHGIGHLRTVRAELLSWMDEHEYDCIRQIQGSMARRSVANTEAFDRANYMRVLSSYALRAPGARRG